MTRAFVSAGSAMACEADPALQAFPSRLPAAEAREPVVRPGDAPSRVMTVSCFRFGASWTRHWAWWQMLLSRWALKRLPGALFMKQCGVGSREGFNPYPDFGAYGLVACWESPEAAEEAVERSEVYRAYRDHAVEEASFHLAPTRARGSWAGFSDFGPLLAPPPGAPLAVLTRASIRPLGAPAFWRAGPAVRADVPDADGLLFRIGMGEVPWLHQITFTVWRDEPALHAFAHRRGSAHAAAARAARERGWFSEELFARFRVEAARGRWSACPGFARLATPRPVPAAA